MMTEILIEGIATKEDQVRDISTIAGRNVQALLGIAEWIEETGHPRKADAVRVMAYQLDEAVGELGSLVPATERVV